MPLKNRAMLSMVVVAFTTTQLAGEDWPGIYGPRRDHSSVQKRLLKT